VWGEGNRLAGVVSDLLPEIDREPKSGLPRSVDASLPLAHSEPRRRRILPQVRVADAAQETLGEQRVECLRTVAFFEGPAALRLRQRDHDTGMLLELAANAGEQTSGRHTGSSLLTRALERDEREAWAEAAASKTVSSAVVRNRRLAPLAWTGTCYDRASVDTPVRLLVVDLDACNLAGMAELADEEGVDLRTACDAISAIRQCRLEYLDLVMINAGRDGASGVSLLQTIRMLRPTVRAVLMNNAPVPIRQLLRDLRSEPRHVPCCDEFQHITPHAFAMQAHA
jgi:CheY-like chemotaxis protein